MPDIELYSVSFYDLSCGKFIIFLLITESVSRVFQVLIEIRYTYVTLVLLFATVSFTFDFNIGMKLHFFEIPGYSGRRYALLLVKKHMKMLDLQCLKYLHLL